MEEFKTLLLCMVDVLKAKCTRKGIPYPKSQGVPVMQQQSWGCFANGVVALPATFWAGMGILASWYVYAAGNCRAVASM